MVGIGCWWLARVGRGGTLGVDIGAVTRLTVTQKVTTIRLNACIAILEDCFKKGDSLRARLRGVRGDLDNDGSYQAREIENTQCD